MVAETKPRILIVEDESIVAADIEQALKNEGYLVAGIASSGEDAISLTRKSLPDLVLMDIRLHGKMTGIEAADQIRNNFHIPFIFLTAYSDEITVQQAKVTQPYGYLLKPFGQKELRASIETALYRAVAERKLAESEQRNRLILDTAFDAFVAMNQEGIITDWNQEAQATFGWSVQEAKGRKLKDTIIPERFREAHEKGLAQFLTTGEGPMLNRRFEITALHKTGREFPVELTISPVRTGKGHLFSAFIHDISKRKQAEETQIKWSFLFENAKLGIAARNKHGTVFEMVNPEFARMHGYTPEELIGKTFADVFAPEGKNELQQHIRSINESGQHAFESTHLRKDGTHFPVQTESTAVKDPEGGVLYHLSIVQDLTEKKRLEMEEKRSHELERSNAELEDFASITSHDLQEPLRTVRMYSQLLTSRFGDKLDAEAREFVRYMVGGVQRMQDLISALLDYSRVGGDENQERKEIDVESVLQSVTDNLKGTIEETKAKITYKDLPRVMGHPVQVGQLFQNLIGNALKFQSTRAPAVQIEAKRDGDFWLFSVRDNGIGFEEARRSEVFQAFRRLHSRDEYPGTGIGLATCKKIVELYGGRIWAESKPNEGSTFYFTLPPANPISKGDLKGIRILHVDDSAEARALVSQVLKGSGVYLETASGGREALEMARASRYDLILMDIEMPVLSGVEVASEIRQEGLTVPIIAFTGHQIDRIKKQAPPELFNDYMPKSLEPEAFLEHLSQWGKSFRRAG